MTGRQPRITRAHDRQKKPERRRYPSQRPAVHVVRVDPQLILSASCTRRTPIYRHFTVAFALDRGGTRVGPLRNSYSRKLTINAVGTPRARQTNAVSERERRTLNPLCSGIQNG
jgi:hypothetical protein